MALCQLMHSGLRVSEAGTGGCGGGCGGGGGGGGGGVNALAGWGQPITRAEFLPLLESIKPACLAGIGWGAAPPEQAPPLRGTYQALRLVGDKVRQGVCGRPPGLDE